MTDNTYETFTKNVRGLLSTDKRGYNQTGPDGPNQLQDFVHDIAGHGHALGEIIYKVVRFAHTRDPRDIEKIAAWAFLIWRKHWQENTLEVSEQATRNS